MSVVQPQAPSALGPRVAALWFPDWPIQAARLESGVDDRLTPTVIVRSKQVEVSSTAARTAGITRGMRLRQAQALCPHVRVIEAHAERDGALFEPIAGALDDVAASVEIIRPGLVAVDAAAAGRFHGGEDKALEMLIDAAMRAGLDMTVGCADELATAIIAARAHEHRGAVVAPGGSREFLAAVPVNAMTAEATLGVSPELSARLRTLGVNTLGALAALPLRQVAVRFGQEGVRAHRIASAQPDRAVAPAIKGTDLAVFMQPGQPIMRVDAAAFASRQLAVQLHDKLKAAGVVCLRLEVVAEFSSGVRCARTWRTRQALAEADTADRVRWQLDGWLHSARAQEQEDEEAGIVALELHPIEVSAPEHVARLWDNQASDENARRAIARVQSQLGQDRVLSPYEVGGRGVAERIAWLPHGDKADEPLAGPWEGKVPSPVPARLGGGLEHPASRMRLVDSAGQEVIVTAEALLSGVPCAAQWGASKYEVTAWAGPWPVDTGWWNGGSKLARLQLVGQQPGDSKEGGGKEKAWLLVWSAGWRVEAAYF